MKSLTKFDLSLNHRRRKQKYKHREVALLHSPPFFLEEREMTSKRKHSKHKVFSILTNPRLLLNFPTCTLSKIQKRQQYSNRNKISRVSFCYSIIGTSEHYSSTR